MSKEKKIIAEEIEKEIKEEAADFAGQTEALKKDGEPSPENEPLKENAGADKKTEAEGNPDEKYLRLLADYQNMKRRVEQEKADIYAYGNEKIVKDMLDVIDNFERALEVETTDKGFKEGIELILKQFKAALEKAGVSEIEALGKEFDPSFHNAVMMEDNPDFESGHVTCVLQKGYILNSRVVRPAMVKVAN